MRDRVIKDPIVSIIVNLANMLGEETQNLESEHQYQEELRERIEDLNGERNVLKGQVTDLESECVRTRADLEYAQRRNRQLESDLFTARDTATQDRLTYDTRGRAGLTQAILGNPEGFLRAVAFLRTGQDADNKIRRIKKIRELGSFGLKEAKDLEENFAEFGAKSPLPWTDPNQPPPGVVPSIPSVPERETPPPPPGAINPSGNWCGTPPPGNLYPSVNGHPGCGPTNPEPRMDNPYLKPEDTRGHSRDTL